MCVYVAPSIVFSDWFASAHGRHFRDALCGVLDFPPFLTPVFLYSCFILLWSARCQTLHLPPFETCFQGVSLMGCTHASHQQGVHWGCSLGFFIRAVHWDWLFIDIHTLTATADASMACLDRSVRACHAMLKLVFTLHVYASWWHTIGLMLFRVHAHMSDTERLCAGRLKTTTDPVNKVVAAYHYGRYLPAPHTYILYGRRNPRANAHVGLRGHYDSTVGCGGRIFKMTPYFFVFVELCFRKGVNSIYH